MPDIYCCVCSSRDRPSFQAEIQISFGPVSAVKCFISVFLYWPGCCGTWCECCLVYQNAENMGKSGILCFLLGCVMPCIPSLLLRGEARERWGIEVSV